MNSPKRRIEFPHYLAERQLERRPPPDQHIIVAGVELAGVLVRREPYHFPQAAPNAVALDRITHLPRDRESDPHGAFVRAPPGLEHKRAAARSARRGGSPKVRPALQPLHGKT
jgi:hypothetical protein